MSEFALVVEHLTKRFGDRVAVDDVSFEVGYGEVFGFLGPNGAGKTTTVRTLGTLIEPSSGSAVIAGIPLSARNGTEIRSRISVVPESPGLYLRLLTTHRMEEAERLCDRVAIQSTTLRLVGRPDELRMQLFRRSLDVRLHAPLDDPKAVLDPLPDVEAWEQTPSGYTLTVSDPDSAAPALARALIAAGADIRSIAESRHSLEDVYLELIDEDVEAKSR
jgi:ABC-type multidrug transport system ATPase subunit